MPNTILMLVMGVVRWAEMDGRIQVCLVKDVVKLRLSQLDPEGCYMRKCHRLRRRVYRHERPNAGILEHSYNQKIKK